MRLAALALVLVGVVGCSKPISPDEACALASAEVGKRPVRGGNPQVHACESFASSGDEAMIQVQRDYQNDTASAPGTLVTFRQVWQCSLRHFDQGWQVVDCAQQR